MKLTPSSITSRTKSDWKSAVRELRQVTELKNQLIKNLIIEERRIDVLAGFLLGIELNWHHLEMLAWQESHDRCLILSWRGSGKTTSCTVIRSIAEFLWNPDVRILIASKSHLNAVGMLDEIKGHTRKERFQEVFGDLSASDKWDTYAINVANRKIVAKEHTVDTTGVETALPSRHWDLIIADDLVDEPTARTEAQRTKLHTWFYKTLDPCLEPDGRLQVLGTNYHHEDLHAELEANEMKESTLRIPVMDKKGRPAWPQRFPVEWCENKEKQTGKIIYASQYMLDVSKLSHSPFAWENISNYYTIRKDKEGERVIVREGQEIPMSSLQCYQGVDPSSGTVGPRGSFFGHVTVGMDEDGFIYILDYFANHITFSQQLLLVESKHRDWKPIRIGCEANAYQKVLVDELRTRPALPVLAVITVKDKRTRVLKRTATFEQNRVWLQRSQGAIQDHLVSVLDSKNKKDIFDALDIAIALADSYRTRRRREVRRTEPDASWGRRKRGR